MANLNILPGEWELQTREADRKRKFADLLRQSQQPQGQMVGNMFVAPSWTQRLAAAVNQWQGGQMQRQADDMERKAIEGQRQTMKTAGERLAAALQPKISPALEGNNTDDAAFMSAPGFYQPETTKQPSMDEVLSAQVQYANDIGDPAALQNVTSNMVNYRLRQQDREDDRAFRNQGREDEQRFRAEQAQLQREAQAAALKEQIAAREQAGQASADLRRDLAQMQMQNSRELAVMRSQNGQTPYFQAVPTPQGIMRFNARTGQMEPVMVNGSPVMKASDDPSLQGDISQAKAGGKVLGETAANAQINLPQTISQGDETIGLIDDLLKHPGFDSAVGLSSYNPLNRVAGQPGNDFNIRLDQLKGKQFLQAFETLKGGGQITEVEGKKATDAISRMNASASEDEFKKAAREFQDIVRKGVERAKAKAGGTQKVKRYNPSTGRIE
jgi:hypothetical protein